jgi:hypothetical protein
MTNISQSFFISRVHQLRTGLKYLVPRAAAGQLSHPRRRGGLTVSPCSLIMSSSITKNESAPRTELNLCVVDLNPFTGRRLGPARRLTHWTDFQIYDLSASVDGHRVCFIRSSAQANAYIGEIQAHGTRLASLRQLTNEEAYSVPGDWTRASRAVFLLSNRNGSSQVYKPRRFPRAIISTAFIAARDREEHASLTRSEATSPFCPLSIRLRVADLKSSKRRRWAVPRSRPTDSILHSCCPALRTTGFGWSIYTAQGKGK